MPAGIRVLKVHISDYYDDDENKCYVGVTPGKTYTKLNGTEESWDEGTMMHAYVKRGDYPNSVIWADFGYEGLYLLGNSGCDFTLSWSPEINEMKPAFTDY